MIIQDVVIENYLCYYDVKKFEFATGLNIILGENGEGKTKFFEAVDWLFKDDVIRLEQLVSAKKLSETAINDSFRVRVSLVVKQGNETKILTRQFSVKKISENECVASKSILDGIEESNNGERNIVDGIRLMEYLFPVTIRKYSMFKGEAALDIFDTSETLITLIQAYSEAKYFDKYEKKGIYLQTEAENAVDAASRSASKNQAHYNKLETAIKELIVQKNREKTFLDSTKEQIIKLRGRIEDAKNYVSNAKALGIVNDRITIIRNKIETASGHIDENYTTSLLDDKWILMNYESIHKEFTKKVNALSAKRRELQSNFDTEVGIKIGEKRAQTK
jgi:DNA sulfur modification protein DndD